MDAAEQWEPDEARASRPVLRARGGEIPPRDSPRQADEGHDLPEFVGVQAERECQRISSPAALGERSE